MGPLVMGPFVMGLFCDGSKLGPYVGVTDPILKLGYANNWQV